MWIRTSNKAVTFSSSCYFSSYLLYSSILSPHAKLEDPPLRIDPSAKKQQRGRLHATCRWSWLLAGESIIESRHTQLYMRLYNTHVRTHAHTYTLTTQRHTRPNEETYVLYVLVAWFSCYYFLSRNIHLPAHWFSFGPFFGAHLMLNMAVLLQKEIIFDLKDLILYVYYKLVYVGCLEDQKIIEAIDHWIRNRLILAKFYSIRYKNLISLCHFSKKFASFLKALMFPCLWPITI